MFNIQSKFSNYFNQIRERFKNDKEEAQTQGNNIQYDPFVAAKQEWNERYGDYIARARNYRLLALITSITSAIAVTGMFWVAAQKTYVPYIVEVDQHGKAEKAGFAKQVGAQDSRLIKAYLVRFISNWRDVTIDPEVRKMNVDQLYSMLPKNSAALEKINNGYKSHSPNKLAQMHTVTTEVKSLLPLSKQTWQVEWVETTRNLDGKESSQLRWKAFINVSIPEKNNLDERIVLKNPLGLFITDINWSKEL